MSSPVVQVAEGKLSGTTLQDIDGGEILAFLGVPFGKPPVGDLRFKPPQPVEKWDGVKECTVPDHECIQRDVFITKNLIGSEDCLYSNIFTKSVSPDKLRPVLVFIHGGGFIMGSNNTSMYGPQFLLTEDIVLVTINYRLGMLGFLSLDDLSLDVAGNAGLKDQTLALRWIQKNIEKFGGDPNNVTLAGQSSGSYSVHYHVLSPSSQGLFHKAILQSGAALNPWAYPRPEIVKLAKLHGSEVKDEKEALEYLKKLTAEQIFDLQEKYIASLGSSTTVVFGPVVEKANPTAFLTEEPIQLISTGRYNKIPLMFGYCNREGLLWLFNKHLNPEQSETSDDTKLDHKLALFLKTSPDSDVIKQFSDKVQKIYGSSGNIEEGTILLYTDVLFIAGIVASVELHAKTSSLPVYLYQFSLDAGLNTMKVFAKVPNKGACHGDDLGYLFKTSQSVALDKGSVEEVSVRRFVKLVSNFVQNADPTPVGSDLGVTWKKVEQGNIHYLDIGENLTLGSNPEPERMQLWQEIGNAMVANKS